MQNTGNVTGLCYYYAMIVRNVFFYEVPAEEGSLQMTADVEESYDPY
jgi:hypothetical protein